MSDLPVTGRQAGGKNGMKAQAGESQLKNRIAGALLEHESAAASEIPISPPHILSDRLLSAKQLIFGTSLTIKTLALSP
jgi:hypothetical protein